MTLAMVPATITGADADFAGSATLVAEMFTVNGVGIVAGAVYRPVAPIVPTVPFPPEIPFTVQVTDSSGFPPLVIAATNCRVLVVATDRAFAGFVDTPRTMSLVTVTAALADLELSA